MSAIRREANANFINWKGIETGSSRFTPCAPLEWLYEISEPTASEGDTSALETENQDVFTDEDLIATQVLAQITPSNEELRALAAQSRPPDGWLDDEEEAPF